MDETAFIVLKRGVYAQKRLVTRVTTGHQDAALSEPAPERTA